MQVVIRNLNSWGSSDFLLGMFYLKVLMRNLIPQVIPPQVPPRVSHNNVFFPKGPGLLGIVYHYDESHSDFFSEFFEAF